MNQWKILSFEMEYRFINGGRQYKRLLIYYYWIEKWKYSQTCKFRWFQVLGIGNTNWKILVTISVPTESNSFRSCCNSSNSSSSSSRRRVERTSGQVDEGEEPIIRKTVQKLCATKFLLRDLTTRKRGKCRLFLFS